jgi:hypothetical protein
MRLLALPAPPSQKAIGICASVRRWTRPTRQRLAGWNAPCHDPAVPFRRAHDAIRRRLTQFATSIKCLSTLATLHGSGSVARRLNEQLEREG